ncbi:metallophosphoesterase [Jiangella alba]|uniref:2',3'-cyclic-nucleotide 2'-phosphodiesterase/5'-or 3'-nucleotidase, 5'-nucleotidase family n=1 Tax=Jiangella alba TaxID=561176 RepID=A0A1H5PY71_9ACTN|nr:metallophosphoesterase [Jiangella alba]SEF18128.1 2',3'-cyclic-nucleotide 2'-phosphodiesterase/5'-or 3'-nucleotidase, 5'-nucleotidase family [Jiangella alba]
MTAGSALPPRPPDARVRLLATNDLLATVAPLPAGPGRAGTVDGVAGLLELESRRGPAVWLDAGDFTGGPLWSLTGRRDWALVADLPIGAAAAGNHEFDEGTDAARSGAGALAFPLLCANADAGLAPTRLIDTAAGVVGVIGLTHPQVHRLAPGPEPVGDPAGLVRDHARRLREAGADWIVVLQHDGVEWWPETSRPGVRSSRWLDDIRGWSSHADVVLGGHTLGRWSGRLGSTVVGHAHPFAASVLVVDLTTSGAVPAGFAAVAPAAPGSDVRRAAAEHLAAAAAERIGTNPTPLTSVPGAGPYLPSVVADAFRSTGRADAAFVPPHAFFTQAPVDGAGAALAAGPVSELDLHRLFPFPDDAVIVARIDAGELGRLRRAHDQRTDPRTPGNDHLWWNWSRTPAGVSDPKENPHTVALLEHVRPLAESWLGRPLAVDDRFSARDAMRGYFR